MTGLLLVGLLLQAPAAPDHAAAPVPTQAELQARSDAEMLRLEVERLARRVAELEGLVAALSRPTIERLSQERQQLEQDLQRAGYTRDAQGRVTRRTEPETPPAPPAKEP